MKAHWFAFLVVLATTSLATTACEKSDSGTPPRVDPPLVDPVSPEPTPPAPTTAGERAMKFMDTLATAIEAHTDDCDKMADAVDQVFADHADFVTLVEKLRSADPDKREQMASSPAHADFEKDHGADRGPMLERISSADACMAKNQRLRDALARLGKHLR